jgi:hypothetical protein
MPIVFRFWTICWVISILLILLRSDNMFILSKIFGMLFIENIFSFILSIVLIYIITPLTIPFSIYNIIKSRKNG